VCRSAIAISVYYGRHSGYVQNDDGSLFRVQLPRAVDEVLVSDVNGDLAADLVGTLAEKVQFILACPRRSFP
jgi:hypothetical protein